MTHNCPVSGCGVTDLKRAIMMCRRHWGRVPRYVQIEVYRTWNDGAPRPEYLKVRQAAIDAAGGAA